MKPNEEILKTITNDVKSSICALPVVTPTVFSNYFQEIAQKHSVDLEDDEYETAKNVLQDQCTKLTELESRTSQNVNKLDENTSKAIEAIKTKDETTLNNVLSETKALRAEIEKLKEAVYKDTLTQAYNRKWLHDNYLTQKDEQTVFTQDGTLAMIDLNYFKQINDTHGHIIGDKVLQYVTITLQKLRVPVIRYGGDEFVILFHRSIDQNKAIALLNEVRDNMTRKKLKAHNATFLVCFSFGTSSFHTGDVLEDTLEAADKEMYTDKIQIKKRFPGI